MVRRMRHKNRIDAVDALAVLTVEMLAQYFFYGDDGEVIHPFERLRREHITHITHGLQAQPIRPRGFQK